MRSTTILVSVCALAGSATAAVNFQTPAFRGGPGSSFAAWDLFTSAWVGTGPNFPDVANTFLAPPVISQVVAPDPTAGPAGTGPGILLSGGGNIYTGFQNGVFVLDAAIGDDAQEVVFQTRALGTPIADVTVALEYIDGEGLTQSIAPSEISPLFAAPGPPIFGQETLDTETLYRWDLSGVAAEITSFSIGFTHFGPHLSLDEAELDVRVPAPSSVGVLALAGLAATRRRR